MYNPTPNLPAGQLYNNGAVRFDTRQIANMLYQEQRMNQFNQQRQAAAVDKQLQDEIGKVRSADTQPIVDDYNSYKNLRTQLYNKKNQRDPVKYAELQRASDLAYRNLMGGINASVEYKEAEKNRKQAYATNPDLYADDFGDRMATSLRTPTRAINKVQFNGKEYDFSNEENFRHQGTNTDFSDIIKKSAGEKGSRYTDKRPLDDKGLQTELTEYKSGNDAHQRYDYLLGAFGKHSAGRDAAKKLAELPEGEFERVAADYSNTSPELLKKKGVQQLTGIDFDPNNKAAKYAAYLAMKGFNEDMPEAQKPSQQTNEMLKMQLEQGNRMAIAKFNKKANEDAIRLRSELKKGDDKGNEAKMGEFVDGLISDAKKTKPSAITSESGDLGDAKKIWELPSLPSLKKTYQTKDIYGKDVVPNGFAVDKDDNVYAVFYKRNLIDEVDPKGKKTGSKIYSGYQKAKDGSMIVDENLTVKVPKKVVTAELSKQMQGASRVDLGTDDDNSTSGSESATIDANYFESLK